MRDTAQSQRDNVARNGQHSKPWSHANITRHAIRLFVFCNVHKFAFKSHDIVQFIGILNNLFYVYFADHY